MLKIWGKMNKEMERVTYEESIRERISLSKEGWKTSFRNALTKIFFIQICNFFSSIKFKTKKCNQT